jgi:hypothetical protein
MEDSTGHDTRGQAEQAFGGAAKPGLFARLRGRRQASESPTIQSGPTTSVSGIPAQIKPAAHAQTQVEARAAAEAQSRPQRTPPTSPAPVMRTVSSGTSIDVGRLIRVLVIVGIVIWVAVTIINAASTTVHSIKIPSFPGITVPSTPGFSPSPTGTSTAPLDNFGSSDFARSLQTARAKAGGGATVVAIRVDPGKATFIVRGAQGQKVITITGDATQVFASGGGGVLPGGISLSAVQGAAPHRIIARLKSRFGVSPSDVEYLAAIGNSALGGILWSAHLKTGEAYTADGSGRTVKRLGG